MLAPHLNQDFQSPSCITAQDEAAPEQQAMCASHGSRARVAHRRPSMVSSRFRLSSGGGYAASRNLEEFFAPAMIEGRWP